MRKVWVVATREYLAAVRTKSFIVSIVLLPILMSGGAIAQALLKNQVDLRPRHFALVDRTSGEQFAPILELAIAKANEKRNDATAKSGLKAALHIERVPPPRAEDLEALRFELSERVRRGELTGFLEIGPEVLKPVPLSMLAAAASGDRPGDLPKLGPEAEPFALRYQTNRPAFLDFSRLAEATLKAAVMAKRATERGVVAEDVATILRPVPVLQKGLTTRDPQTGRIREGQDQNIAVVILLPGGLVILMFMMVLLGAAPLMQGVIEEKMQRIAEVLLGSIRPFQLMMGKLIGMSGMSLTMTLIYLAGTYVMVRHYGYAEYLTPEVLAWFLTYQVLALFMFGSIYAAVGAACTDMKEAQAMMMPVTIITMLPLFVWLHVVREPTSTFSVAAALFPPATPMLMVARLSVPPSVPTWQPVLGVVLVLATTLLCVYAAGRIFRVGILLQGKGARIGDLLRWVVRG